MVGKQQNQDQSPGLWAQVILLGPSRLHQAEMIWDSVTGARAAGSLHSAGQSFHIRQVRALSPVWITAVARHISVCLFAAAHR